MDPSGLKCSSCHCENREEVTFCEQCGARLRLECPNCQAKIPLGMKFCGECGGSLPIASGLTSQVLKKEEYWNMSVADYQVTGSKRRKFARHRANFDLLYGERNSTPKAKALVRDVSPDGLGLRVRDDLPPGSRIILEIRQGDRQYYASGEVKWCKRVLPLEKSEEGYSLVGVDLKFKSDGFSKFLEMLWETERKKIKALLRKRKPRIGESAQGS